MKKPAFKAIAIALIISHLGVVCFQDAALAADDDAHSASSEASSQESSGQSSSQEEAAAPQEEQSASAYSMSDSSSGSSGTGASALNLSVLQTVRNDLFTGSASLSVPIAVPSGRGGLQPALSLSYSSQKANGICGVGWDVGLGFIQRSVKRGIPTYRDSDDTFVFISGAAQELVNVSGNEYQPKLESAFSKFTYSGNGWVVTDKRGTKYYFGSTSNSKQTNTRGTFAWYLAKVIDVHGNYLEFNYTVDEGQPYPYRIEYSGNEVTGDSHAYRVEFILQARPDTSINYRSGAKVITQKRIKEVSVTYSGSLVRKYVFDYEESPSTRRSRLLSVTQYGADGTSSLPPVRFGYQEIDQVFDAVSEWASVDSDGNGSDYYYIRRTDSNGRGEVDMLDINGDGLIDRVMQDGANDTWEVQLNNGSGFDAVTTWGGVDGLGHSDRFYVRDAEDNMRITQCDTFDINGDARPDRVMKASQDGIWKVQLNNGQGFDAAIDWGPINNNNRNSDYYHIRRTDSDGRTEFDVVDINGDGLIDRVMQDGANNTWEVQLNNGSGFDTVTTWSGIEGLGGGDRFYVRDVEDGHRLTQCDVFDINGDGLPDRVVQDGANDIWEVQLNIGDGFAPAMDWGPIDNNNRNNDYYYIRRITSDGSMEVDIFDINGDGLPDRVMQDTPGTTWEVQLNTGTGFTEIITWSGVDSQGANDRSYPRDLEDGMRRTQCDIFDLNGDGIVDRVMQNGANNTWETQAMPGYIPDLLVSAENSIGGRIDISYTPSTQYSNTGTDAIADLPFPVPVVSSLTTADGQGNSYTTSYSYQGGAYSSSEREFRGFGRVIVTDAEGNYSENYFKQDDIYKGRAYKQIVYDASGNIYTKSENTWAYEEIEPGVNFAYLTQSDAYTYDGDETYRQVRTTYEYDTYGNPTTVVALGEVSESGDEKSSVTEYTVNTTDWIFAPKHVTAYDASQNKISEQWFYYDGSASIDDAPQKGFLTKEEVWFYNPLTSSEGRIGNSYGYDTYGNLTSVTNSLGRTTVTEYDTTLHIYPVRVINPLSHMITSTYDYKTGQTLTTTDPNNQTTTSTYDTFGRLTKVIGPLDSEQDPAATYTYDLSSQPIKITKTVKATYSPVSQLTSYQFYDGLGRLIQGKSPAEDDPSSGTARQVVSGSVVFDSRGNVSEKYLPYFVSASSDYSPPNYSRPKFSFSYDTLGRLIQTTNADNTSATLQYSDWVTIATDENGHAQTNSMDVYGRVIKVEEHNQGATYTTTYEYDAQDNLVKVTDDQANITQIWYDSLGRKLKMDDPDMGLWQYEYDDLGNLTKQIDAKGQELTFSYDIINRLTEKGNQLATYHYDDASKDYCTGRLSMVDDQSGATEFYYDQLGREIKSIKTINGSGTYTVERTYDAIDRIVSLTYPDGEVLYYEYNNSGAMERVYSINQLTSQPINHVANINYTETGQISRIDYGNDTYTNYTYNPNTLRLSSFVTESGQGKIQEFTYAFDNVGNVSSITDHVNSATQSFSYDDLDRLIQAQGSYGTLGYTYDSIGNMTYKEGVNLTYGKAGKLPHAVTQYGSTTIDYDANGNMSQKGDTLFTYDTENRLIMVEDTSASQSTSYSLELKSGWNFFSLPVLPDDASISSVLSSIDGQYDQVSRYNSSIDEFEHHVGNASYDDFSSLEYGKGYQIYVTDPQGATLTVSGTVPEDERVTLAAGWNLIGANHAEWEVTDALKDVDYSRLLRYNEYTEDLEEYPGSFSKLEPGSAYYLEATSDQTWQVTQEGTIATDFVYDGDGGRVRKITPASTTTYVGSLYEITDGEAKKHIFAGANRVCSVETNGTYYFHSDHLGSSNVITDENGEQVSLTEYTPYGGTHAQEGTYDQNYKFTGKELDPSTGLYYYGARYYDPELGRFTQADTIVPNPFSPQTLNRYTYCNNNPLKYVDPSGHFPWVAAIIGAIVGAATGAISAHQAGGSVWQGALFGAVLGFTTGAIGYNVGQSLASSFLGSGGVITAFEGAIATGVEFGIGAIGPGMAGGFAGGKGSVGDIFKGGAIGFATGFGVGAVAGYTYTAGWQNIIHGVDTQGKNIQEGLKKAHALADSGNIQAAVDKEQLLIKQYGLTKVVEAKRRMTISLKGRFVRNNPTVWEVTEYTEGNTTIVDRNVLEYNDGLPNFKKGWFFEVKMEGSIKAGSVDVHRTVMSAKISYTNMPVGYKKVWFVPKIGPSSSYGGFEVEASGAQKIIYGRIVE